LAGFLEGKEAKEQSRTTSVFFPLLIDNVDLAIHTHARTHTNTLAHAHTQIRRCRQTDAQFFLSAKFSTTHKMAGDSGSWINWRWELYSALLFNSDDYSKSIALVDFVLISHGTCVLFCKKC